MSKAIHYLYQASKLCNHQAQLLLGTIYYYGNGTKQDIINGRDYIILASKSGYTDAYFAHGFLLHEGKSMNRNIKKAIQYYKEASSFNNQYAKNNLGIIYKYGYDDVDGDVSISIEYFEEAIRQKIIIYQCII